jgi:hypothetical protein
MLHKLTNPKGVFSTVDQNWATLLLAYLSVFVVLRNNAQRAASRASELPPLLAPPMMFLEPKVLAGLPGCLARESKGGQGHRLRVVGIAIAWRSRWRNPTFLRARAMRALR